MKSLLKLLLIYFLFITNSLSVENKKFFVYFYETEDSKNETVKTDFIYQARAGWFVDENYYAFAVKINNKVKQSGNEIVQYFNAPRVYSLNNKSLSEGKFEANELITLIYDQNTFDVPYGNYNLTTKKYNNNFNFEINYTDNSITWSNGNKKYIFKTYDQPKILKTLIKCHMAKNQTDSKKMFEIMGYEYKGPNLEKINEVCKSAMKEMTNYLMSLNKEYVQNFAKKTNQDVVKKKYNNATYIGEMKDELPHGKGKILYNDGRIYEGELNKGRKHGFGKLYYGPRGTESGAGYNGIYVGEWQNGKKHGKGKEKTDGRQGNWNILTSVYSGYYEGNYENGFPNGEILVVIANCHTYDQENDIDRLLEIYENYLDNCKKSPFYKGKIKIEINNNSTIPNINGDFTYTDSDRNVFEIKYKNRKEISKKILEKSSLVLE